MEYLDKVLGVKVTYDDVEFKHLPNFIATRYRLQMVSMNEQKMIFLYPKTELEQIEVLKKHIARIQKNENLPVVLVLRELSFRQKEYLIREKIPFIVDGKQIYLPFMAVYLQERCSAEKKTREEILPAAQMLLLHFIYGGAQELSTSQAAKDLELTPTSISRASRQLEEMGLLHIRKVGVQRIMQSEDSPKTLFQKAGDKLLNPIKRTVYIPKELVGTELLESGYSALAEYSMLNTPNVRCYAAERISQWKDVMTNSLQNSLVQVAVEMWRYNPRKLSTRNIVDELSLALALREDADERHVTRSVRKMNLLKIHHIAIIVSDYEAAKDFYVNKLGFSVIRENYRPERKDWKLDLRVNEQTELEIFAVANPPKRVNRPEACGLRHLAFCVDSVEQTVNELAEVGIECEPIRIDDYTGKKMTFFHDPDGLPLELHE